MVKSNDEKDGDPQPKQSATIATSDEVLTLDESGNEKDDFMDGEELPYTKDRRLFAEHNFGRQDGEEEKLLHGETRKSNRDGGTSSVSTFDTRVSDNEKGEDEDRNTLVVPAGNASQLRQRKSDTLTPKKTLLLIIQQTKNTITDWASLLITPTK